MTSINLNIKNIKFNYSEVHKIAILDMRILNADRHSSNILVKK